MRGLKRGELIKEERAPSGIKKLFSLLLVTPLLSLSSGACAFPAKNKPVSEPMAIIAKASKKQDRYCMMEGDSLVYRSDSEEKRIKQLTNASQKLLGVHCSERSAFVLTSRFLYISDKHEEREGSVSIKSTWKMIKTKQLFDYLNSKMETWVGGDGAFFFLTKNGVIIRIDAAIDKEENFPAFNIPYKTEGASMAYQSGFLFIAPLVGRMVIMKMSGDVRFLDPLLPGPMKDGVFYFRGDKLFFGNKEGKMIEIRVDGTNLIDVKMINIGK